MNATLKTVTGTHSCACGGYVAIDAAGRTTRLVCNSVTKRTFAPGHDARLKGFLIKAGREGLHVQTPEGGADQDPAKVADRFGFGHQVRDGIARKAPVRKGRKNPAVANPARKCTKVTAKVGRWVYEGELSEHGTWFTYTDKKGEARNTKKFTVQV